ncbi:glycosyltransferase [bacterium]|nr:glycosyltransferase [bacterium]
MADDHFIIVTPVYEDSEAASKLFQELNVEFGDKVYIVAVDDGSIRQPIGLIDIENADLQGAVIKLKRNVGHQRAIAIGLNYVAENFNGEHHIVVMDSDGEDTPSSIRLLLKALNSKDVDITVAKRKSRVETLKFRVFYIVYKWIFKLLSGREISFGNFMALKPIALKRLITMQELWLHVAGCTLMSKLRITSCELDRGSRYAGQSKMNFVGLVLHGFKGLMIFAEDVLVRVGIVCAFIAFLAILASIVAVMLKTLGFATPGWFSVALGILILVFLQTGALTLMSLMLTGVVRNGLPASIKYMKFIETVHKSNE